jgi:hypothetical protein
MSPEMPTDGGTSPDGYWFCWNAQSERSVVLLTQGIEPGTTLRTVFG